MPEYEWLLSAIGSVGFPIVACCFMGWFYVKMCDTLNGLTTAITELSTKVSVFHTMEHKLDEAEDVLKQVATK